MKFSNYPKFRVKNYGAEYSVQARQWFIPFWYQYEDGYYGVHTYSSFEKASERIEEIIMHRLEHQRDLENAKNSITGEEISVNEFVRKYPEKFL